MTRIAGVRLTPVAIPRSTGLVCGHVIVELDTDDGLTGLGEMSDFQHLPRYHVDVPELERTLSELLGGLPAGVEGANEIERRLSESFPPAGSLYDKTPVIRCGVDLALWDLRGKLAGLGVSDLLGGAVRESLPVAYPIFRQQAPDDIPANLDLVAERLEQGFFLSVPGVRRSAARPRRGVPAGAAGPVRLAGRGEVARLLQPARRSYGGAVRRTYPRRRLRAGRGSGVPG